jgi:glyoxylase-like metal-dependent hydrolase (beta-lactamase superfamily II)
LATPVKVDQIVADGDVLPLHGGLQAVETSGHTLGHVAFYLLKERLLFTGDCLNNVDGLAGSMPQYTADARLAKAAVKKLAALAPDSLAFGHGPAIVGGAAARLRALAEAV